MSNMNINSISPWCSGFLVATLFLGTLGCGGSRSVQGFVTDEAFRPVSGAIAQLVNLDTRATAETTTDEQGFFWVEIAYGLPVVGRFAFTVSRRGYVTYRKEFWGQDESLKIVLARDKETR